MTPERLDWHLDNWSIMLKTTSGLKLGYPSKSLILQGGGGSCADEFEIMCDEVDLKCGEAMDGIIDSISQPQRTAINHVWMSVPHHYPTQELDYDEALESITKLAIKRKLT